MILLVSLYSSNKLYNWLTRLTPKVLFASNKPIMTCFGSQSKINKLMTRAKVWNAPLPIHKSNVTIIKPIALTKGRTNSWSIHFIIKGNISLVRVLHDGNTTYGPLCKLSRLIHMLSTMFKRSNPFITSNKRSSMKAFYSSCDFFVKCGATKNCRNEVRSYHFSNFGILFFKRICFGEMLKWNLININFPNIRMFTFPMFLHGWSSIFSFI